MKSDDETLPSRDVAPVSDTSSASDHAEMPLSQPQGQDEGAGASTQNPADEREKPPAGSRIKIGSQRKDAVVPRAKPQSAARPSPEPRRKYPPPNLRGQLPPDLEREVNEALGKLPIEDLMEASAEMSADAEMDLESRITGRVTSIHHENVFLDLGGRNQGVASLDQFAELPEIGQSVEVIVQRQNTEDGLYEVTFPGQAVNVADWSQVAEGMTVEARVTGHNKGGLECDVGGLRGFMPASQVSMFRVEDFSEYVDQRLPCVVTECNASRRNLVLSHRAVLERQKAEAREKLMAELDVGQLREGIVRKLLDFGAFVDLGGVDGLIPVNQMSWDRIKHPSEVLHEGQKVNVKIEKFDRQSGKISLAFRDLTESPWARAGEKFHTGDRIKGTVSKLMDFGAFVRIDAGVEGLIHISELSHKRVFRVSDVLQEGQEVEVQVLSVDAAAQRISLSLKALEARPEPAKKEETPPEAEEPPLERKKKRAQPLKGGLGKSSGGDKFGLRW